MLADEAATERLGARIAASLRAGDCVLLDGPLGAGKSTLCRALLRAAAGDPSLEVPSPSYTLVQHYRAGALDIAHFDLWRLDGPAALPELGWEEARAGAVLVEWADRLGALAPADALHLRLETAGDARRVRIAGWGGRGAALAQGVPDERHSPMSVMPR